MKIDLSDAQHQGSDVMSQYPHLYNSPRWRGKRGMQRHKLATDPLCWYCEQMGRVTAATVVDHITPHKGDEVLFYDWDNLRSACKSCHDSAAALKDRLGYAPGVGGDGLPVDGGHWWNKK